MHFVLKWGFEVNPVSNSSRMMETEDFGDIVSFETACKGMQGQPEKNGLLNFLKVWHHVEFLTVVILVQKVG